MMTHVMTHPAMTHLVHQIAHRAIAPSRRWMLGGSAIALGLAIAASSSLPRAIAQERQATPVACFNPIPLMPVGGSDPEVVKRVSPPGFLVTRHNWDTDFVVPSNSAFSSFRVNLFFKNGDSYNVAMFLKYNDDTADSFYNKERTRVSDDQLLQIPAFPRRFGPRTIQPFQVNVRVGNTGTIGNTYIVSVDGCQ